MIFGRGLSMAAVFGSLVTASAEAAPPAAPHTTPIVVPLAAPLATGGAALTIAVVGGSRFVFGDKQESVRSDPGHVYTGHFSPPITYRIHNGTSSPGWSVVVQASAPEGLANWTYNAGTGTIVRLDGQTLESVDDTRWSGDLRSGLKVLSTHHGLGTYLFTLGTFSFTCPKMGPAGTYRSSLTVLVTNAP